MPKRRIKTPINKRKEKIENDALEFLKKNLFIDNPDDCPFSVFLFITKKDKKIRLENYENDIKIFKALFNSGIEDYKVILWNKLVIDKNSEFYKKDFSRDEFEFLKSVLSAYIIASKNNFYYPNVNEPMKTDRLILRAINKNDKKLFAYHFKSDGNFAIFSGRAPTTKNIKDMAYRELPTLFTIEEQLTHKVIGYVGITIGFAGITIHGTTSTGLIEYYIFKEFRKQGYCKEAIKYLVNKIFNQELYDPVETLRETIFEKKVIKVKTIRARISAINTASINTIKSCGFIHEATIHNTMYLEGIGWTDEEIYYLPNKENK